ncbi:nucleotide exchange factor GrpE [Candidatus Saccharibacteria bacterium RIFCSPLOWO2_01_FULL_48_13]|nr:MAG: nucleotide exchange factor GrpE [Candidatus Saccharibacteria bacterium RIFCSPHIGHO2_01_FULL_48_12]OGL36059.1 MAG: nucleotide exchange factor GrpE [Candidatus Saccharibacteria bacterium RIFCSPHIGHO2_12_FULL_48_21]OGL37501.1 MAG: nucleotide exchange factor GrpE [Candidatus Saccharibacteria bacterium RIFCSPLOWO2_01_FULL_48_13]
MAKKRHSPSGLEAKIFELTEALKRERADAENVRRRAESEKMALANFHKRLILQELLPAIDNLERALKHVPKELSGNPYVKGVQGVAKEFDSALAKIGIERIKTIGEHFDPHLHEAISIEKAGGKSKAGDEVVCEELQPGYMLGDEVIRHAMVRVKRS